MMAQVFNLYAHSSFIIDRTDQATRRTRARFASNRHQSATSVRCELLQGLHFHNCKFGCVMAYYVTHCCSKLECAELSRNQWVPMITPFAIHMARRSYYRVYWLVIIMIIKLWMHYCKCSCIQLREHGKSKPSRASCMIIRPSIMVGCAKMCNFGALNSSFTPPLEHSCSIWETRVLLSWNNKKKCNYVLLCFIIHTIVVIVFF